MANIHFSDSALETFEGEVEKFYPLESGGVLLGYIDLEKDTVFVVKATKGGAKAIHEKEYFKADKNYIDMMIDMEYANSNGKIIYLGEWHTHPQVIPVPSEVDMQSLSEIANSADHHAILLIIGAIGYYKKKFKSQSICILKYNDEPGFYKLDVKLD